MDNVGYGVSQALPIFVEMLSRSRGSTFAIQQPEVHLHPRAQAAVGDLIAELAVHEQKRFFVETHSDFTIDRFRINLKRNRPSELDAQILFFERIDGGNRVTSIPIDNDGTISADQPDAYRAFFLNEQLELLA
jgi:predicted ATPase